MANQKWSEYNSIAQADLDSADLFGVSDLSANESKSLTVAEADARWTGSAVDEYSSAQTLTSANKIVIGDTSSAAFTITLPAAASSANLVYTIQKKSGLTDFNKLTISDGGSFSTDLFGAGESVSIYSDGTVWRAKDYGPSSIMDWTITSNITATTAVGKIYFNRGIMKVNSGLILPTAAGAATPALVTIPTGLVIKTADLANGTDVSNEGATNLGGQTTFFESGVAWKFIQPKYASTTQFGFFTNTQALGLNQLNSGDGIHFSGVEIPVA